LDLHRLPGAAASVVLEPLIPEAPLMGIVDCSSGSPTTTVHPTDPDSVAFARIKLVRSETGPDAPFTIQIDGGAAGGWARVVWNDTGQTATVIASAQNPGVAVPSGHAYHLMSDGTNCVRVE